MTEDSWEGSAFWEKLNGGAGATYFSSIINKTLVCRPMMNNRLRLLSGNEPLMLDPTDGWETLGQATDVFRNIDRNFER